MIWPVRKGKTWGGIDVHGDLVIPFGFECLGYLSEGLISFAHGGRVGFLDSMGSVVVKPMFDMPLNRMPIFRDHRASVSLQGRSGYAGPDGNWAVPPCWTRCWDFVNDKAVAESEQGYFVISALGEVLSSIEVYEIPFLDGWPKNWECFPCHFSSGDKMLVGFINWKGATVFAPRYPWMTNFFKGVAGFCDNDDETACPFGLVDDVGRIVVSPTFFCLSDFENELARAGRSPREFGFINHLGEWVIEPKYRQALPFSEGMACVTVGGKNGFINIRGEMIIEPRFDRQAAFRHGLASVEFEGKRAYINKLGQTVWEIRLEDEW